MQVQAEHIIASYLRPQPHTVLHDLSFAVKDREVVGVTGPSGCGKSTLLHILAGLHSDYSGTVLLDGSIPDPKVHTIALVQQQYGLLPWFPVKKNILLPSKIRHAQTDCELFDEVCHVMELGHLLERYPHQLSGGQRQRVALARAFCRKPQLLLLDEAFSALDIATAERCRKLFRELWQRSPVTTVMVSHNPEEIEQLCSQTLVIAGSPGRLVSVVDGHIKAGELRRILTTLEEDEH